MCNHRTRSGQESWYGSPQKDKNDDYPNGLACEFVQKAKKANKPSDASAMIEMDIELDRLQLEGTGEFYNDMVGVLDKF